MFRENFKKPFNFVGTHHSYPSEGGLVLFDPVIMVGICQNLMIRFGEPNSNSDIFIPISLDPLHIFQKKIFVFIPEVIPYLSGWVGRLLGVWVAGSIENITISSSISVADEIKAEFG